MQPRVRIGLIVGAIGAVLNICFAGVFSCCGPILSLVAGGLAGYFAAQEEKPTVKNDGARIGATAGGIAGGLIILGQIIGGVGALAFTQFSGAQVPFGQVPSPSGDPSQQVIFYVTGIGTALCLGLVGAGLAAGAGALTVYFTTPDQPAVMPPPQNIIS